MADAYEGLTIKFGADTSDLSKAMREVSTAANDAQRELRQVQGALKLDPSNLTLLEQKQRRATEAAEALREKIKRINAALASDEVKEGSLAYDRLNRELVNATSRLDQCEAAARDAAQAIASIKDGSYQAAQELRATGEAAQQASERYEAQSQKLQGVSDTAGRVGDTLTMAVTAPLVAAGAASVNVAMDFESGMSRVAGALGKPADSMGELSDLALQMGADTIFSATESAAAMEELAKGGLTEADIKAGALKSSMDLAAAGGLDLATASNVIVQSMGAFGLTADETGRAANSLAGAANASSTDVYSLTQGLSQCSASAKNAGWSIEDTTALLGEFAYAGVTGSDAGTSLKTMLQRLSAPTDDAASMMEQLGIEVRGADGNMKSAADISDELKDALGSVDSATRDAALSTIFGSDAMRAAVVMTENGSEGLKKYTDATNDSTSAARMADAQMGDMARAIEEAKGAVDTAAIKMGGALAPAVKEAAKLVGDLAEGFANLDEGTQKAIVTAAAFAAAIGPTAKGIQAVTSAGSGLLSMMGKLKGAQAAKLLGETNKGVATLGTGVSGLTGLLGPLGIAIGVAGGALSAFSAYADDVSGYNAARGSIDELTGSLGNFAAAVDEAGEHKLDASKLISMEGFSAQDYSDQIGIWASDITGIIKQSFQENGGVLTDEAKQQVSDLIGAMQDASDTEIDTYIAHIETRSADVGDAYGSLGEDGLADLATQINDSYGEASTALDENLDAQLAAIEQYHTAAGTLNSEEYQAQRKAAIEHYEQQKDDLDSAYQEQLALVAKYAPQLSQAQADAARQAISDFKDTIEQNEGLRGGTIWDELVGSGGLLKFDNAFDKSDAMAYESMLGEIIDDTTSAYVALNVAAAAGGAQLDETTRNNVSLIVGAFDGLPESLQDEGTKSMRMLGSSIEAAGVELGELSEMSGQQIVDAIKEKLGDQYQYDEAMGAASDAMASSSQRLVDASKTAGADAVAGMAQSMLAGFSEVKSGAMSLADGIALAWNAATPEAKESGDAMVAALVAAIQSGAIPARDAADAINAAAAGTIGQLPDKLQPIARLAAEGFGTSLQDNAEVAGDGAQGIIERVSQALSAGEQGASASGVQTGAAYTEGVAEAINNGGTPIYDAAGNVITVVSERFRQMPQWLAESIASGQTTVSQAYEYLASAADAPLAGMAQRSYQAGADAANKGALGVSDNAPAVSAAAALMSQQGYEALSSWPDEMEARGKVAGWSTAEGFESQRGEMDSAAAEILSAATSGISPMPDRAGSIGSTAGSRFASGVGSYAGAASSAGASLASSAISAMQGYGGWAYSSGAELGGNFASGVRSQSGSVAAAASQLASAASSYLHFTEPDIGPLVGINESGEELAENYAASMLRGRGAIEEAARQLAQSASFTSLVDVQARADATRAALAAPVEAMGRAQRAQVITRNVSGPTNTYTINIDGATVNDNAAIRRALFTILQEAIKGPGDM